MKIHASVLLILSIFIALCLLPVSGCSRHTKVQTTETVDSGPGPDARASFRHEETKTVEKEEHSDSCSGVLSCGVDVVGEIIAFPFKALGALATAIF